MIVLGLLLGMVGTDVYTGTPRFTFGFPSSTRGINFVAVAVGVFGIAEILRNLENEKTRDVMVKTVNEPLADAARTSAASSRRCCAAPPSARCSASCRAAARARLLRRLHAGEAGLAQRRRVRQGRDRGRRRRRKPPTMPGRRPRSSRC